MTESLETPIEQSEAARLSGTDLASLLLGTFLALFDFFVTNVSLPSIGADLHAYGVSLTLVVGAYALTYGSGLLLGSQLGGRYGHMRVFRIAMACFLVSSLVCAAARTPAVLIFGRVLQGASIAGVIPQILTMIKLRTTGDQRKRALSWYARTVAAGQVSGQVFGGLTISFNLFGMAWRWAFILSAVAAGLGILTSRNITDVRTRRGWDMPTYAGVTVAILLFFVAAVMPGGVSGTSLRIIAAVTGVLITAVIIRRERSRGKQGYPGDLSVLSSGPLLLSLLANACFYAFVTSFFFIYALYLQRGLSWSPAEAGAIFLAYAAGMNAGAYLVSHSDRTRNSRLLLIGTVFMTGGIGILIAGGLCPALAPLVTLVPGLALAGAGNGLLLPVLVGQAMSRVSPERAAAVSGILPTAQQLGGAVGVTILGALYLRLVGPLGDMGGYRRAFAVCAAVEIILLAATWITANSRRK